MNYALIEYFAKLNTSVLEQTILRETPLVGYHLFSLGDIQDHLTL
jgi:hypothetical protein